MINHKMLLMITSNDDYWQISVFILFCFYFIVSIPSKLIKSYRVLMKALMFFREIFSHPRRFDYPRGVLLSSDRSVNDLLRLLVNSIILQRANS